MGKKRIVLLMAAVSALLIAMVLISYIRTYASLNISFKDDVCEYGEKFDAKRLIGQYSGELHIENEPDTAEVGDHEVRFVLSRQGIFGLKVKRTFIKTISVKDSKAPVIEFKEDSVRVYQGSDYDLSENISRVYDVIDGDIADYVIETDGDPQEPGEYLVSVTASDRNGLRTQSSYTLNVRRRVLSAGEGYDLIYEQLTGVYGFNRAAACGILANIRFESNFVADIGDYYYGLCQWGGSRKDNLFAYCAANGLDAAGIEGQLAYLNYELRNAYSFVYQQLQGVSDSSDGAYEAALIFCNGFEGATSDAGRGELARDYYG